MEARRPKALELGCFLLVVGAPIAFTPFSAAPFADLKLLLVALGTFLLWLSGVPVDRRFAAPAAAWVAVTALATLVGVDPTRSMTASVIGQGGGLILVACSASLLAVGPNLPEEIVSRIRGWLGWTALAVAGLQLAYRVWPDRFSDVANVDFAGSTFGNQLFASAFIAVGVVAVASDEDQPLWRRLLISAVLVFGLASAGERSSAILPVVGLAVMLWKARLPLRRAALLAGWVVAMFVGWQLVQTALPATDVGSAFGQFRSVQTDTGRIVVWKATAEAALDRPILGWGPNTTQSAYLHTASLADVNEATRGWNDAHDLFLETTVSSGFLGLAALLWLLIPAVRRSLRGRPELGWAAGAAAALGAFSLVEPEHLVLTPLLFLLAGVSARAPGAEPGRGWARKPAGAGLAIACLLTVQMFVASAFEQWGSSYGEPWAYRAALRIQPWRLSATEALAKRLSIDGRSGDAAAAAEVRRLMAGAVDSHPWDTGVRTYAGDLETILKDPEAARRWYSEHLARFPSDAGFILLRENAPPGLSTSI